MVLTRKLEHDDPVLHMNGEYISLVGKILLLGLTIDRKLKFIPHVAKACNKATNIYKEWGLSPEILYIIYYVALKGMPGSPYSLPAFRYNSLEATSSRHQNETSGLDIQGEARKGFGRYFYRSGAQKTVYFGGLPHPAHMPEVGYESIEDLESQTMDCLALVGPQSIPTVAVYKAKSVRP
ncbi:hypothetical protein EVAR_69643_1 [Eumeta japonica]|uniref:Uncharacterized protein n=1 Tax=Eumeta variegata TaxID=151549 RepID=A0A4C1SZ48_EUMVA|nr:hypothetical protein EVAR_69643_1 [Eumeta japonica]